MNPISQLPVLLLSYLVSSVRGFGGEITDFHWMMCGEEGIYAREDPWDCSSYIMCSAGNAFPFRCPPGTVFNKNAQICDWPHKMDLRMCSRNPLGFFDPICKWKPNAKLASQLSCAQYYDCSQSGNNVQYAKYVMECPYPQLFSEVHGTCLHYSMVHCGKRPIPKAPCDYIQYQQLCPDPQQCAQCHHRHPSCVGRHNGVQPIHTINNYYMFCDDERTITIEKCPNHQVFSERMRRCVSVVG